MAYASLFPPLPAEVKDALERFPAALATVLPLTSAHRRSLPRAVEELSVRLTRDRASLHAPYWSAPRLTAAYLYYFLPWNLLRLTRLLGGLMLPCPTPLPEQPGAEPAPRLLVDLGSGPLTLPLALWLARPQWRHLPLTLLCLDTSPHPLELGKALFTALAGADSPWIIHTRRAPAGSVLREVQHSHGVPWLCSSANMLNELSSKPLQDDSPWHGLLSQATRFMDAPDATLLLVEPGTRLGGTTLQRLRTQALEDGLTPLSPCPHSDACPLSGRRTWCHFTFDCTAAPDWLTHLSRQARLEKTALSLSFLLLTKQRDRPAPAPATLPGVSEACARVISAPFPVPGLQGQARYACTAKGLTLLAQSNALPPGSLTSLHWPPVPQKDRKSGAWILLPDHYEHAAHPPCAGGTFAQEQTDMTFKKHREFSSGSDVLFDNQHKTFHKNSDKSFGDAESGRSSFARNERKRFEGRRDGTFHRDRDAQNFAAAKDREYRGEKPRFDTRQPFPLNGNRDTPRRDRRDEDSFGNVDPEFAKKRFSRDGFQGQRQNRFDPAPYGDRPGAGRRDRRSFGDRDGNSFRRDGREGFQRWNDRPRQDGENSTFRRPFRPFDDGQRSFGERSFSRNGNREENFRRKWRDEDSFGNVDPEFARKRFSRDGFQGQRRDRFDPAPYGDGFGAGRRDRRSFGDRDGNSFHPNRRRPQEPWDSDPPFRRNTGKRYPDDEGQRRDFHGRHRRADGNNFFPREENAWRYRRADDNFGNRDPGAIPGQSTFRKAPQPAAGRSGEDADGQQQRLKRAAAERRFPTRGKVHAPRFRSREDNSAAATPPVETPAVETAE